jgi:hypothetical protein
MIEQLGQTAEKVQSNLLSIQLASLSYPVEQNTPGSIDDVNTCSRSREFNIYGYNNFEDGIVIAWTTDGFLEHRSHRLIVPRVGNEHRYHREPFNVDCQSIGSSRVNAKGAEEIMALTIGKKPEAAIHVDLIADDARRLARLGWADGF